MRRWWPMAKQKKVSLKNVALIPRCCGMRMVLPVIESIPIFVLSDRCIEKIIDMFINSKLSSLHKTLPKWSIRVLILILVLSSLDHFLQVILSWWKFPGHPTSPQGGLLRFFLSLSCTFHSCFWIIAIRFLRTVENAPTKKHIKIAPKLGLKSTR